MAVITTIKTSPDTFIVNVQLDAGDATSGNIAHGLGAAPDDITMAVMLCGTVYPQHAITTMDATNLVVTKSNAANTAVTLRITAKRFHHQGK